MNSCQLNPYHLGNDINNMYDIVSASKAFDVKFGGIDTSVTFDMPKNINFVTDNINHELNNITNYINTDINTYLSCLATKSEAEILSSLQSSVSHITELFNLIPKINNLIPNIEKLKRFIPENEEINANIQSVIDSVKVIDKYASTLITLLLIILCVLILILSISTLTFVSLFIKNTSSLHMIIIILIYLIITFITGFFVKRYIEGELNTAITGKLETLKVDIDQIVNQIRSNL
jgi:hypothetical protein